MKLNRLYFIGPLVVIWVCCGVWNMYSLELHSWYGFPYFCTTAFSFVGACILAAHKNSDLS